MADSIGHEFLRTLQVPLHHAHQNQALQRGENYLSDYPSVYLRIYLSVCLYCLPTNLFLFLSLFFAFGIVWLRLHRLAALQWRSLDISSIERRRLCCTVLFHCAAALCVIWSLCVLIERAADDVKRGLIGLYILPCNPSPQCIMPTASCCAWLNWIAFTLSLTDWPFWTKLGVVTVGLTGGIVFMYIQCKAYLHLCHRWKARNRQVSRTAIELLEAECYLTIEMEK